MQQDKQYHDIDLKPYNTFGFPLLKFLFGIAALSFLATAAYEFFF